MFRYNKNPDFEHWKHVNPLFSMKPIGCTVSPPFYRWKNWGSERLTCQSLDRVSDLGSLPWAFALYPFAMPPPLIYISSFDVLRTTRLSYVARTSSCYSFSFLLAVLCGMWNLSSPTKDGTYVPCSRSAVLTTGPLGKSLLFIFISLRLQAISSPVSVFLNFLTCKQLLCYWKLHKHYLMLCDIR